MKRTWYLTLSLATLAGCATLVAPPGTLGEGPVTLTVQPTIVEGGYRTQAIVKEWTAADIDHVVVSLSKVDGVKVEPILLNDRPLTRDIPAESLSLPVAFRGLTRNTTYRILARAYRAQGEKETDLISKNESSFIDLKVEEDDRPRFEKRLPVQLQDVVFSGVATGSFAIGNGSIVSGGAEEIVSEDADGPAPDPTPVLPPAPTPAPTPAVLPEGPVKMASDDSGDPLVHHDYTVTKNGVPSAFVWVPVFEAYQLIVPGNCGYSGQPVGIWVANRPSSGTENVDWARETFGGFYAGK